MFYPVLTDYILSYFSPGFFFYLTDDDILFQSSARMKKNNIFVYLDTAAGYLLGVDWGVGIIKSPDHIVCKPGAGNNGTQP